MKFRIYPLIFLAVISCDKVFHKASGTSQQARVKDTIAEMDKDEHGCLASAGYIWSKVGGECVKLYSGVALNPVNQPDNTDPTSAAFVLFSADVQQAEVFMPNTETSTLLKQQGPHRWAAGNWVLQNNQTQYQLSIKGVPAFEGDSERGLPVADTDQGE